MRKIHCPIDYKDIAIKQLEYWGWDVEKYRLYGLPWYLKWYLYPIIWGIKGQVESIIRSMVREGENVSEE